MAAYRSLAPPSPCRGCPKWQMDRDHILIAISVQRLFALMLVIFGVIYALPKDLELLRPPLRLALLLTTLVDGDDASTARMSPDAKSQLTIHWIHLYLDQKRAAAAAAAQRGC